MWKELWSDFEQRATRLAAGGAAVDAVDQAILWQLVGHPTFVGARLEHGALQLPELYSGAPWDLSDVRRDKPWIAFVTVNPSIEPREVFPNISDLRELGVEKLVSYFDRRFEPGPYEKPLLHGRNGSTLAVWSGDRRNPQSSTQPTWRAIDRALHACLSRAGVKSGAPLGRYGAILDVVPWKFKAWSSVPVELQGDLLKAGAPYLRDSLTAHPPRAIVVAGRDAQQGVASLLADPPPSALRWRGHVCLGDSTIPVFGTSAPTAFGDAFARDISAILEPLIDSLGSDKDPGPEPAPPRTQPVVCSPRISSPEGTRARAVEDAVEEWVRLATRGGAFDNPQTAVATIRRLQRSWGMTEHAFAGLHHMGHDSRTFCGYCGKLMNGFSNAFPGNIYLARRLACAEQLRAKGFAWVEFIEELNNHPFMPRVCTRR